MWPWWSLMNGVVLSAACFLLSALVLCVFGGVRVWVVSEGLVTSHCICSVALVTMATRVEIKQGIVSERSGKCVLMWVWGNSVARIVSFWLSSPGDATNPKQQRGEKSLSQSTRNFAQVAPSLCMEYGFIAEENPLSIQIHHEGNNSQLSAFKASMRTHEIAQTLKTSRLHSAGNSPHLLSGLLARDCRCVLSCFKIDIISLAVVNISQSPFIRITGKFSWKRLILCSASS